MKKLIITLFAVLAMTFSAKAQMYVGGMVGLGISSSGGGTVLTLSPEVGYDFNSKIGAGVLLELQGSPFTWSLNPYFRWKFAQLGKATFLSDFMASFGGFENVFTWGIHAMPGISFEITDKVSFVTRVASIGVSGGSENTSFNLNLFQGAQIGLFYKF